MIQNINTILNLGVNFFRTFSPRFTLVLLPLLIVIDYSTEASTPNNSSGPQESILIGSDTAVFSCGTSSTTQESILIGSDTAPLELISSNLETTNDQPVSFTPQFTFSEEIADDGSQLIINGHSVPVNTTLEGQTLFISPISNFSYGADVTVDLKIKDYSGNTKAVLRNFSIEKTDNTPPKLVLSNLDTIYDLSAILNLQFTFNEAITDNGSQLIVNGNIVPITNTIKGKTLTITPISNFPYGANVTVDVKVKDPAEHTQTISRNFSIEVTELIQKCTNISEKDDETIIKDDMIIRKMPKQHCKKERVSICDNIDQDVFHRYLNLKLEEARRLAKKNKISFRVVSKDGQGLFMTMDYSFGRINAKVNNGIVTDYSIEGIEQCQHLIKKSTQK